MKITEAFLPKESGIEIPKNGDDKKLRESIKAAFELDDRLQIVEGELLQMVSEDRHYTKWGYTTFDSYVEAELGFKRRKAYYLMDIYDTFVNKLDLPMETLRGLEWSKAKELTKVITKENCDELLKEIKDLSVAGVRALVKAMKGGAEIEEAKEAEVYHKITLPFAEEQYKNVTLAIEKAKKLTGSASSAHAVDIMATSFLSEDIEIDHSAMTMETLFEVVGKHIDTIERCFGVVLSIDEVKPEIAPILKDDDESADGVEY